MIARDSHTRDGPSARARRSDLTRLGSDRRNPDKRCGKDGPLAPEARNISLHNFTDQPGSVVLIGVTIPGLGGLGKIALPFIYRPFHHSEIARA